MLQDVASNPISRFEHHWTAVVGSAAASSHPTGFSWSPTAPWHRSIREGLLNLLPRMCHWINNNVAFPCNSCRFCMFEIEDHSRISQPQQGKTSYSLATLVSIWLQCFQQKTIWTWKKKTFSICQSWRDNWTQSLRAKDAHNIRFAPFSTLRPQWMGRTSCWRFISQKLHETWKLDTSYFEPNGMTMMTRTSFGH